MKFSVDGLTQDEITGICYWSADFYEKMGQIVGFYQQRDGQISEDRYQFAVEIEAILDKWLGKIARLKEKEAAHDDKT